MGGARFADQLDMRLVRVLGTSVMAGLCGWFAAAGWIDQTGTHGEGPVSGCATVVLGARVDPGGEASDTLRARVLQGVEVQRRLGGLLVISGGVGTNPPAEADVGGVIARARGVPDDLLRLERSSHSTRENARESAVLLRGEGHGCVNLVSDPSHLARARWAFEREGFIVHLVPVLDAPRHVRPELRVWWTLREVPAWLRMWLAE